MYISRDPIGLNGSINFYGYVANLEIWIDSLELKRLPISDGEWMGEEGNSVWKSSDSDVEKATDNKGVRFKNGSPDFSPYSDKRYSFKKGDLDGTDKDFNKVYKRIKEERDEKDEKDSYLFIQLFYINELQYE